MTKITIGNRSFELPVLVPSISSFETQLAPADALRLQIALGEPISLVSAYDVGQNNDVLPDICREFRAKGVLLMDSGGYESSRIRKYVDGADLKDWDFDQYKLIASHDSYDFIFSFDYFLTRDESPDDFVSRLQRELEEHLKFLKSEKLIPVIHLQSHDGKYRLGDEQILSVFAQVARAIPTRFIAVPERELGHGILSRARLAQKIVRTINSNAAECSLHILGCGNLLSYSLFSLVGVMMCDGLEWCRTLAAENFHLHHFQQRELFFSHEHELADAARQLPYPTAAAVYNLHHFQKFANLLQSRLESGSVDELVSEYYGVVAGAAARSLAA